MPEPSEQNPQPTKSDLTWPALLAHWTTFAQSSLALPKNAAGDRWRSAVPAIINLQAVTFALGDLGRLSAAGGGGERALALDRSEIIIRSATGQLHALWRGEALPDELVALVHDAGVALDAERGEFDGVEVAGARQGSKHSGPEKRTNQEPAAEHRGTQGAQGGSGVEWRVTTERLTVGHPSELVERLLEVGFSGDLFILTPGVPLFQNAPAAFAREAHGGRPDEHVLRAVKEFLIDVSRPEDVPAFRQVYRQFDFAAGRAVRDLVVPGGVSTPAGQPLLVPAIRGGKELGVTLPPRKSAEIPPLEVVFQDVSAD